MPVTVSNAGHSIMDMSHKDPVPCRNCQACSGCSINASFTLLPYLVGINKEVIENEEGICVIEKPGQRMNKKVFLGVTNARTPKYTRNDKTIFY